ncbi:MAG: HEPN family nuclease [bacterium]|nr:HEPN family nuclease [bacterium]
MIETDQVMLTLARRTKVNLDFVYAQRHSGNVYEFTQLLNSMLSMLISMRAEYFSQRATVSWDEVFEKVADKEEKIFVGVSKNEVQIKGDSPTTESPNLINSVYFSDLIDRLRNAFAHCCFELERDSSNNIHGLTVWNVPIEKNRLDKQKRKWQASISEPQLRAIAYLLIAYLEATRGPELHVEQVNNESQIMNPFNELEQHYPEIIQQMPKRFNAHQFILLLVVSPNRF